MNGEHCVIKKRVNIFVEWLPPPPPSPSPSDHCIRDEVFHGQHKLEKVSRALDFNKLPLAYARASKFKMYKSDARSQIWCGGLITQSAKYDQIFFFFMWCRNIFDGCLSILRIIQHVIATIKYTVCVNCVLIWVILYDTGRYYTPKNEECYS